MLPGEVDLAVVGRLQYRVEGERRIFVDLSVPLCQQLELFSHAFYVAHELLNGFPLLVHGLVVAMAGIERGAHSVGAVVSVRQGGGNTLRVFAIAWAIGCATWWSRRWWRWR